MSFWSRNGVQQFLCQGILMAAHSWHHSQYAGSSLIQHGGHVSIPMSYNHPLLVAFSCSATHRSRAVALLALRTLLEQGENWFISYFCVFSAMGAEMTSSDAELHMQKNKLLSIDLSVVGIDFCTALIYMILVFICWYLRLCFCLVNSVSIPHGNDINSSLIW